jgi:hypothetical protein
MSLHGWVFTERILPWLWGLSNSWAILSISRLKDAWITKRTTINLPPWLKNGPLTLTLKLGINLCSQFDSSNTRKLWRHHAVPIDHVAKVEIHVADILALGSNLGSARIITKPIVLSHKSPPNRTTLTFPSRLSRIHFPYPAHLVLSSVRYKCSKNRFSLEKCFWLEKQNFNFASIVAGQIQINAPWCSLQTNKTE